MDVIKIEVTGNIAKVTEKPTRIVAGTVGMPVEFTFDSTWDGLTKVAVFQAGHIRTNRLIIDNESVVPVDVLVRPGHRLHIGVYGEAEDGTVALPTIWVNLGQIHAGATPGDSIGCDPSTAKKYYDMAMLAATDAEEAANRADEAAETAISAAETAKEAAKEAASAGESAYYSTTRELFEATHDEAKSPYFYGLYDALMGEYPNNVQKKEWHSNDGTFTNYEYVISTREYPTTDALYATVAGDPDPDIKKPKYLILSGVHGTERNAALSVYRFIRDVLNGHNVPTSFKEGAVIHIMPVGTPSAIDNFTRRSGNGVDINRNFASENPEKETQAIINWMTENRDADLFVDVHNNGAINEVVAILGDSSNDAVDMAKKIAIKGVDRIIPFWRDVIGYPPVEAKYAVENEDGTWKEEIGLRNVVFSYCADVAIEGTSIMYATKVLSVPGITTEFSVFYGNESDRGDDDKYPPETIAAGAEAIGNILIEFYKQSFVGEVNNDMKEMNGKLDALMAQVNSGFRMEQGNEWEYGDSKITIKCSLNPKLVIIRADEDTDNAIIARSLADPNKIDFHPYGAIVQTLKDFDTKSAAQKSNQNGVVAHYQYYSATKTVAAFKEAGIYDTDVGIKFGMANLLTEYTKDGATVPAVYNWTAYYWNE